MVATTERAPERFFVQPLERDVLEGVFEGDQAPAATSPRHAVDVALLPIFSDERPLQGVAGLIDWRDCGRLSSYLRRELANGTLGDQLLTVGGHGLPAARVVLLGLGARADMNVEVAQRAGRLAVDIAQGLDAATVLVGMPSGLDREVADALLSALVHEVEGRAASGGRAEAEAEAEADADAEPDAEPEPEPKPKPDQSAAGSPEADGAHASDDGDPSVGTGGDASAPVRAGKTTVETGEAVDVVEAAPDPQNEQGAVEPNAPVSDAAPDLGVHGDDGHAPSQGADDGSSAPSSAGDEGTEHLSPAAESPPVSPFLASKWWFIAEGREVGRLRRCVSGPPRPAADA